jgi:hypothetical protein
MRFKMALQIIKSTHKNKKLAQESSVAPRESLSQTTKTNDNDPSIHLKLPEDILAHPSILNLIRKRSA